MSTNLLSEASSAPAVSTEPRGLIAVFAATAMLAFRNYLKRKAASKAELVSRVEFCAEMLATRERLHANHRDLLAALDRQATRVNALETGLACVDERTRK